jgi:hypothetical protein
MRYGHLPATDSKDNPRHEKITNTKITKRQDDKGNPVPFTFEIPAELFEFPQFESLAEAVNDASSEEKLLAFINDAVAARAVSRSKNAIRNATESTVGSAGNYEDVVTNGLTISKSYTINEPDELSTKQKASTLDDLAKAAKGGTMTPEEIAEALKALVA